MSSAVSGVADYYTQETCNSTIRSCRALTSLGNMGSAPRQTKTPRVQGLAVRHPPLATRDLATRNSFPQSSFESSPESSRESSLKSFLKSSFESSFQSTFQSSPKSSLQSFPQSSVQSSRNSLVQSSVQSSAQSSAKSLVQSSIQSSFKSLFESNPQGGLRSVPPTGKLRVGPPPTTTYRCTPTAAERRPAAAAFCILVSGF